MSWNSVSWRLEALGDLRSLVDRGQSARGGILDGDQDVADRLHGARVAHAFAVHCIGKITYGVVGECLLCVFVVALGVRGLFEKVRAARAIRPPACAPRGAAA